jgi:hypothetical protein
MRDKITKWLWKRMFGRPTGTKSCSNRVEWTYVKNYHGVPFEYKIIRRQTDVHDMYSREELYVMAAIIRTEQARTGWDVFSCFDSPTSTR